MGTKFTVSTCFSFLLLILLHSSAEAQICSVPIPVQFYENQTIGTEVETITTQPGVTLSFTSADSEELFQLNGNKLLTNKVFDSETDPESYVIEITCTLSGTQFILRMIILLGGLNDNPPIFDENPYNFEVNEMAPVNQLVGKISATDLDGDDRYYTLTSQSVTNAFKLQSSTNPQLLVATPLEYDEVKNVQLIVEVQDTSPSSEALLSYTATATINIKILDVDNRPPWFQPCIPQDVSGSLVCHNMGYTGSVVLNEQEDGPLPLKPAQISAIDGDSGLNDKIVYSFFGGDAGGLFAIDSDTGNINMLKQADMLGPISLTVLAAQNSNRNQFATTTVTFSVQVKSLHPPQFQKSQYEGVISSVGGMAMDANNPDEALQILATDYDYNATAGLNPDISYSITGSSDFSIVNGYLFMTKDLPDAVFSLQVVATDTSNDEKATAELSVEVKAGVTTTTLPPSTTESKATTSSGESTTHITSASSITSPATGTTSPATGTTSPATGTTSPATGTTSPATGTTSPATGTTSPATGTTSPATGTTSPATGTTSPATGTTSPATGITSPATDITSTTTGITSITTGITSITTGFTTQGGVSTTNTSVTSTEGMSTTTAEKPSGGYGPADMAALGATLGILLFLCFVVIVVLIIHVHRGKTDWKKIYETSRFKSTLGQGSGGSKEGVQFTNEAFMKDEDGDGSIGPDGGSGKAGEKSQKAAGDLTLEDAIVKTTVPFHALLRDDISVAESDKTDDKEVKPILTKERRADDGYKSVWFKEDIVPNAYEEVVIIPDNREEDSEEDEEEESASEREENEYEDLGMTAPRVVFNDSDMDSGMGMNVEEPAGDDVGHSISL